MSRRWILVGIGTIAVVGVGVAIWALFVSPQTLAVCPSGCAFARIQHAIDAARAGSTLQIQAGTYQENIEIAKPLKIMGSGDVVLEGHIAITNTENVSITALAVRGGIRIEGSRRVIISKSTISHSQDAGIAAIRSQEISLIENTVTGNARDGIAIESSHVRLSHNTIGGNKGYGIRADSMSQLSGEGNRNGSRIPDDFPTIQAAIDAWGEGMGLNGLGDANEHVPTGLLIGEGVIFVAPGIYREQLTIRDKNIRIRGANRDEVILDGTGLGDVDGITVRGQSKVFLENLTVRNFRDDGVDAEGKIELTLRNVLLEGNGSTGVEIAHSDITVWLTRVEIRNNRNYGLWALGAQNIRECRETRVSDNGTDFGALNQASATEIAQKCQ
ncbi:MAG: right-handed parallel beta-helix repeat-containing protein [Candidatus Bipolaricaulota bacterium]|nr:right-handed parallel beta-helix repeat-containing protein [Candidatus Bipolaricaulota bacterium]MDW8031358.1 right-handed parallel beta-helix repeat-containing protein [Candidatus Bipolaricaulota bacterium]